MGEHLPLILVIIVLILLSGFFSATETAYSCVNRIRIKTHIAQGKKNAKSVYKFADEDYNKLVTAILIGNNLVNITASTLATILFTKLIMNADLAATVSTLVLTLVVLIFGEITPKYLASIYPEKCCYLFYPMMQFFYWILWPFSKIFDLYKAMLTKIFRLQKEDIVTDEELLSLVEEAEEQGTLKEDESELVRSALEFDDLKVEDILVPRVDVYAVDEDSTMEEIREVFQTTGYSRLPVYKNTIDNVIGLIHERDFFENYVNGEKEIGHFVQDIAFTSEHTRISTLLRQLQKQKIHMAAVSDEYGGLVGIVTLEDILEELEITDISIMSLSRHFKNHYPKSKEYKQKQLIEALENMKEAYINYPYLEDYFKDKPLEEIENFNREYGFCTDTFTLCEYIPAGKVSNCNMTVNRLDLEAQKEILENKKNRFYFDDNDKNQIFITNVRNRIDCLNCKNEYNEKRLNLLEKIITYNFLNITPENKELYYTLLNFNGNPEEFIETLGKGKEE